MTVNNPMFDDGKDGWLDPILRALSMGALVAFWILALIAMIALLPIALVAALFSRGEHAGIPEQQ